MSGEENKEQSNEQQAKDTEASAKLAAEPELDQAQLDEAAGGAAGFFDDVGKAFGRAALNRVIPGLGRVIK